VGPNPETQSLSRWGKSKRGLQNLLVHTWMVRGDICCNKYIKIFGHPWLRRLRKNSIWPGFVTGHGFSRADKANKMNRALAPAKARSNASLNFGGFSSARPAAEMIPASRLCVPSPHFVQQKTLHLERSLARNRGPRRQVFVAGGAGAKRSRRTCGCLSLLFNELSPWTLAMKHETQIRFSFAQGRLATCFVRST
jgi:hypothetical protein